MSKAVTATPRKSTQILVWLFAVLAVLGIATLTNMTPGGSVMDATQATPAVSTELAPQPSTNVSTAEPPAVAADPQTQTALGSSTGIDRPTDEATCTAGDGDNSFLPSLRWSDFNLSVWDDGFIVHANAILSSFASFLFFIGNTAWSILFFFLDFGITFQPLCTTAAAVNSVVADLGMLASWFAIPAFLFALLRQIKLVFRGQAMKAVGSLIALSAIIGGLFYVTDKSVEAEGGSNEEVLSTTGTVPWMADTLMGGFATAYTSISGISGAFNADGDGVTGAFYDNESYTGSELTCVQYVNGLYSEYENSLNASNAQTAVMTQMSTIWEQAFLSSWMRAQFGSGSPDGNFFPSQVACRHLEATVESSDHAKSELFNKIHDKDFDNFETGLVYLMQPIGEEYRLPVDMLWAGCQYRNDAWELSPGASQAIKDENFPCSDKWRDGRGDSDHLPMNTDETVFSGKDNLVDQLGHKSTILYLEAGEDDIRDFIGYEPDDEAPAEREGFDPDESLSWFRDFAASSIGQNAGERVGQALIAALVSVVYLWAFGPMALGLTIVGFALIVLLAVVPIALLLWAFGQQSGLKILKLTGAATAVLFLFGLLVSLLSTIISILSQVVESIMGTSGIASQILLAAAPVAAVLLLKKLMQMLGLGNITSLAGALGLTSAMAAKAAGGSGDGGVSNAANRGMAAAKRAGATGARGLGATMAAMRRGGPSPLQRLAESRMGQSALGRKAIAGMQTAANKAKNAKDAVGSIAKDRMQSMREEFPETRAGRLASAAANSTVGRGLRKAAGVVGDLAKNKTARYGAALTAGAGVGVAAGAFSAGAIPAAIAATGALPIARAVSNRLHDRKMAGLEEDDRFEKDDHGNLVLKDDHGNDLKSARQLAYARSRGLMGKADTANRRIAARALKDMDPEEKSLYTSNFERAQIAGLPTSEAHREAKSQAVEARKYIGKLPTQQEREAAIGAYTQMSLEAVRARQNGGASAGGMHPGFAGYDNEIAHQIGLETLATRLGVSPDQLVLGNHGIAVPSATAAQNRLSNGAPNLGENASIELASHPALYLDPATTKRGENETDEQYSARITATLTARGLIDDSGKAVDVFKAHGVDVNTTEGANRVNAWLEGGKDPLLSSIEYSKVQGEEGVIKAAQKWTNDNTVDHAERQWSYMVDVMGTRDMALADTSNIGNIPVSVSAPATMDVQPKGTPDIARALGSVNVTGEPNVDTKVIPIQAPAGTASASAQKIDLSASGSAPSVTQDYVAPVTLAETAKNMSERTGHMKAAVANVGDNSSSIPVEQRMREASRALQGVQDMERELSQMLDGLRSSSYARAALSVDHFAATNPEHATHSQLKVVSREALERAKKESEERESILSRHLSDLFRSTKAAQHSPDESERRQAFRAAEQQMSEIEEIAKSLYQEESRAAEEMSAAAKSAFDQLNDAMKSNAANYSGPNRSVISSTEILEEMARRRKEFSDAN